MKKIFIYLILVSLIIGGCRRETYREQPRAHFIASTTLGVVGDPIYFTNKSTGADVFEWNFDDGRITGRYSPSHIFDAPGDYRVSLKAISPDNRVDQTYQTITIEYPTTLEITVLEYYDEYPVRDASVILYETYEDWYWEENPLVEGFTDRYGVVVFTHLESREYFVDVWEYDHHNYYLADEDLDFITTHKLYKNETNLFIAWVDYDPTTKKSKSETRGLKSVKGNRNIEDKPDYQRKK